MKKLLLLLLFPALAWGQIYDENFSSNPDSTNLIYLRGIGGVDKVGSDLTIQAGSGVDHALFVKSVDDVGEGKIAIGGTTRLWLTDTDGEANIYSGYNEGYPENPIHINDNLRIRAAMPPAGVTACFWRTSANGTEISNTSSQTAFSDSILIDTAAIESGMVLRVNTYMTWGHTNSTPTLTLRLRWDAEVIADFSISPTGVSASADPINVEWLVSVISPTTTRTSFRATYYDGAAYKTTAGSDDATLSSTDFSDSGILKFTAQWSAASALNKVTMKQIVGEYSDAP